MGIVCMKSCESAIEPEKRSECKKLSFFFQDRGKRASLPGCDLSDIRQRRRSVPSGAGKQNSPCLPRAQCDSQSSWGMSWTSVPANGFSSRREGGSGKASNKSQGRWFRLHVYEVECSAALEREAPWLGGQSSEQQRWRGKQQKRGGSRESKVEKQVWSGWMLLAWHIPAAG